MKKICVLILFCMLLTGCANKMESTKFSSLSLRFTSINSEKCQSQQCPEEVVVIGTVGAYRKMGNNSEREYLAYTRAAQKYLGDRPISLSSDDFIDSVVAWTKVHTYTIPLLLTVHTNTLIGIGESPTVNYVRVDQEAFHATGDLVSARSNSDGLFFLEKRLCDKENEYAECKKNYVRGVYDIKSGKELGLGYREKKNGKRINTQTYEIIRQ